jgi:DNA-binding NtrC family response regulator
MTREIALISENPQAHEALIRRLDASGFRVSPTRSLAAVLPYFPEHQLGAGADSVETSELGPATNTAGAKSIHVQPPSVLILDSPGAQDIGLLISLSQSFPRLQQLIFDGHNHWPLLETENLPGLLIFRQNLSDPHSFHIIQDLVRRHPEALSAPDPVSSPGLVSSPDDERAPIDDPRPALGSALAPEGYSTRSGFPAIAPSSILQGASSRLARSQPDPRGSGPANGVPLYSEDFLRRVGLANVPVLLHGETGVGKEVMARRLWSYSTRASKPFLKLNCAALPSELIESELFGYEKGAFTGATMDKPGKFEMAQNGTILLDEIGDMDIRLQAKLLQVLQDGEVQPLGSTRILSVNVRVMAATHRDLRVAIRQGSFREDLYYRLSVINLTIPPLRDRRSEILPLAERLLQRHLPAGEDLPFITDSLSQAMLTYPWPGNVRELENVMRRLLVYRDADLLAQELTDLGLFEAAGKSGVDSEEIELDPAGEARRPQPSAHQDHSIDRLTRASREVESKLLLETLEAVRWNRRQAAAALNVDYKAFLYKLQKHGIVESKAKKRDTTP